MRRQRTACEGRDPELWFPIGISGPALIQAEQAKAICRECPVVEECKRVALANDIEFGIWGGTTETERRAIWRQTRRTNATERSGTTLAGWLAHAARAETPIGVG